MLETQWFQKCCYFFLIMSSFVLSRKIIKIYSDIAQKHENVTVRDFWKYEKLKYKQNQHKLEIDFLNNCKQLGVYPKFLIFKLPNVSSKDALSIRKRSHNSKSLQKTPNNSRKNYYHWRETSACLLTSNEIITNLIQYELSQEESNLLKVGLYFSIQLDKIWKFEVFTTFKKIHCLFFNNLKSEETKNQV